MYELEIDVFEDWSEVPQGALVRGANGLFIKLLNGTAAFTADVNSLGGWSGGWIDIPSSVDWPRGPFHAVAV